MNEQPVLGENKWEKINAFRLAGNAARLQRVFPIKNMQRLVAGLQSDQGDVKVEIAFGIDAAGVKFMQGHVEADVVLQCQRCLEPFSCHIANSFLFGMVATEEKSETLPEKYDPIIAEQGMLVIQDVIEDELIISLPIVPMHDLKECKII